jgi:hypothetical protein
VITPANRAQEVESKSEEVANGKCHCGPRQKIMVMQKQLMFVYQVNLPQLTVLKRQRKKQKESKMPPDAPN